MLIKGAAMYSETKFNQDLTELKMPHVSRLERGIEHAQRMLSNRENGESPLSALDTLPFAAISVTPQELLPLIRSFDASWTKRADVIPVNLSDFDGTLTSGASGSKIFEYGVASGFFLESVRPQINETLKYFDLELQPEDSVGEEFLRILARFRSWSQDASLDMPRKEEGTRIIYKMLSWIYAGHSHEEVKIFAERAFRAIGYDDLYLQGAREVIQELARQGIPTVIVSVKFQPILEVAARYFGIQENAVVGMKLEIDAHGKYTGEIQAPMTFREGKDLAARRAMAQFAKGRMPSAKPLIAMGDSPSKSDQQMLEMAHIAIFAEPQSARDAEYARLQVLNGRRAFIVDYEHTLDGEPVQLFDRLVEMQLGAREKFL
jgi:phosphoserine phosphatase